MKSIGSRISRLAAAAAVAAGVGAAGAVVAQEATPQTPQQAAPQQQVPAPMGQQFDDTKLRSFAVAYLEVSKVAQTYQPQLQAAKDPQEQQRIQTEAASGMVKAVEGAEGITVEEYNSIVDSAQADPTLAQKINGFVQEAAQADQ